MQEYRQSLAGVAARAVLTALLIALLGACAGSPEQPAEVESRTETSPQAPDRPPPSVDPVPVDPGLRQASGQLLDQARAARARGALDQADGLLQRAQRIDASNPEIYVELAELYAQRGMAAASRSVAQRGLLYCEGRSCDDLRRLAAP